MLRMILYRLHISAPILLLVLINVNALADVIGQSYECSSNPAQDDGGNPKDITITITPNDTSLGKCTWYKISASGGDDCDIVVGGPGCGNPVGTCNSPSGWIVEKTNANNPYTITVTGQGIISYVPTTDEQSRWVSCSGAQVALNSFKWIFIPLDVSLSQIEITAKRSETGPFTEKPNGEVTATLTKNVSTPPLIPSTSFTAASATGSDETSTLQGFLDGASTHIQNDDDGPTRPYDYNNDNSVGNTGDRMRGDFDISIVATYGITNNQVVDLSTLNPAPSFLWKNWANNVDTLNEQSDPNNSISDEWWSKQATYQICLVSSAPGNIAGAAGTNTPMFLLTTANGMSAFLHEHGHQGSLKHVDRNVMQNQPPPAGDPDGQAAGYQNNVMWYQTNSTLWISGRGMWTESYNPNQPPAPTNTQDTQTTAYP